MYQTVVILKAIVEIAGLALLGQGLLVILAGQQRHKNMFYTVLKTITSPVVRATRFIAPRFIVDQHIGLLAFFLLMVLWVALTVLKIRLVLGTA
jgi:hypothetical protein